MLFCGCTFRLVGKCSFYIFKDIQVINEISIPLTPVVNWAILLGGSAIFPRKYDRRVIKKRLR